MDVTRDVEWDEAKKLVSRTRQRLACINLPSPLSEALGRCPSCRWGFPSYSTCAARLIQGHERGDEGLHQAIVELKISEDWVWSAPPQGWRRGDDVPPEGKWRGGRIGG